MTLPAERGRAPDHQLCVHRVYPGGPADVLPANWCDPRDRRRAVDHHETSYLASNAYVPQTTVVDQGSSKLNLSSTYTYDTVGNPINVDGPRTDVTDTTAFTYDTERRLIQDHRRQGEVHDLWLRCGRPSHADLGGERHAVACRMRQLHGERQDTEGVGSGAHRRGHDLSGHGSAGGDDRLCVRRSRSNTAGDGQSAGAGGRQSGQSTEYRPDGRVNTVRRAVGTALASRDRRGDVPRRGGRTTHVPSGLATAPTGHDC